MVIDSSAVLAILLGEPESGRLAEAINRDMKRIISACSALESSIVIAHKLGDAALPELELLLYKIDADIVPFSADQYRIAMEGWRRFGKGSHTASLNFGDCCSYALSLSTGEPLLFKGDDFSRTDLAVVEY